MISGGSLDTNVIVRLVTRDVEPLYERAKALLENGNEFHVSELAVSEAVYVLEKHYRYRRNVIAEGVGQFLKLPMIDSSKLNEQALSLWADHPKLSFDDCLLSLQSPQPLWTFDKKLINQTEACPVPEVGVTS